MQQDLAMHLGIIKKVTFGLLALVLFAVLLDLVAAWAYRAMTGHRWGLSQSGIESLYRQRIDPYHHGLRPFSSVRARWGHRSARVRVNSLGFRDRTSREVPLRSDEIRVLFAGDSFAEAIGVDYDESFVGIIDAAYRDRGVSVLNASAASYSPIIYWKKIEHLLSTVGLDVDRVVVFLDISDANDDAEEYSIGEDGNVQSVSPPDVAEEDPTGLLGFVANHTILLQWLLMGGPAGGSAVAKQDRRMIAWRASWTFVPEAYDKYGAKGLAHMDLYMTRLHRLLEEGGVPLTLVVYPWPDQILAGDCDSIQVRYWRDWCARKGVRFINLFPHFVRGEARGERERVVARYYIDGDVHWNEAGHRKVADAFLHMSDLAENDLAEQPCDETVSVIDLKSGQKKHVWSEYNLANEFWQIGFIDDALFHYRAALDIDSYCVPALGELARLLLVSPGMTSTDTEEAMELIERGLQRTGGTSPELLDTLALAQAAAGRFNEARAAARQAHTMALEQGNTALAERIKKQTYWNPE